MPADSSTSVPLAGVVEAVVFYNEENSYTIMQVASESHGPVTVRGKLPAVAVGEEIRATGHWQDDRRFGRQFQADRIEAVAPTTTEGIERFLASGLIEGIGGTYAKRIVKRFGLDTFRIIEEASQRLEEVPGIGAQRRRQIKESWNRQRAVRDIMIFLHAYGLSTARALRLYKTYGAEAVGILRADPYRLARDLPGVGFRTADEIARTMGLAMDSPRRLAAGLAYALEQAEREGHCALPRQDLIAGAAELLQNAEAELEPVLEEQLRRGQAELEGVGESALVFPTDLASAERAIAAGLARLLRAPADAGFDAEAAISGFEAQLPFKLGGEQREAVLGALRSRLFVITGGPGVGKTTIITAVIALCKAAHLSTVLCAPTGRAAKRLSESTGQVTFTLHRALEFQPGGGFSRNRNRPLDGDLFVVDEASMVDLRLMASLVAALPEGGRLLFVGDIDQLPSVGAGAVLRDMIGSGVVPVARLEHIYRQAAASSIVAAAHDINRGLLPVLDNAPGGDFFFFERPDATSIAETLRHLVAERIPDRFKLHARDEIQVLTPMNKQSLGTKELNTMLQAALNPPREGLYEIERFGVLFRSGDKVIQTRNNYDRDVFNGDIGHIVEITTEPVSIHVVFSGNSQVTYEPGELDELQLAYAITVHKAQGSEFPAVVVPLAGQHHMLLQRNLLYTALTRGKQLVIIVGERSALERAIRTEESSHRHTGLAERLRRAMAGESGAFALER
jgi:exodeoxyribonuclease V alpha subunit